MANGSQISRTIIRAKLCQRLGQRHVYLCKQEHSRALPCLWTPGIPISLWNEDRIGPRKASYHDIYGIKRLSSCFEWSQQLKNVLLCWSCLGPSENKTRPGKLRFTQRDPQKPGVFFQRRSSFIFSYFSFATFTALFFARTNKKDVRTATYAMIMRCLWRKSRKEKPIYGTALPILINAALIGNSWRFENVSHYAWIARTLCVCMWCDL